jgi:flagellar export protein FliJ
VLQALTARHLGILAQVRAIEENCRATERATFAADIVDATELGALSEFKRHCTERLRELRDAAADCRKEIAAQQEVAREFRRKKLLLEKLKERKLAEYTMEANRHEEHAMTELFLMRKAREVAACTRSANGDRDGAECH